MLTYDEVCQMIYDNTGLIVLTSRNDYHNTHDDIVVTNGIYKAKIKPYNYYTGNKNAPSWFNYKGVFIIENINAFLQREKDGNFICLSNREELLNRDSLLKFQCTRCGEIINTSLHSLRKQDKNHKGISCPYCDDNLESLHALVLKQIYKHYYPHAVEEDPSCINPNTGKIMPTDIVDHKRKIAIEIQGQFHNRQQQKQRDIIKKNYWIENGYKFYDYPIDNISVLNYVQYFFPNINEIPEWVNLHYSSKLDVRIVQQYLDDGLKIPEIQKLMNVNVHRIYDAIQCGKIKYPDGYCKSTRPVVKLDLEFNYLERYVSYTVAEKQNNLAKGLIASCIFSKHYYSGGYYWIPEDVYLTEEFIEIKNKILA